MTHACQYGADHSGWNKHIRCTTKPHYALVHSFPCGRHYPYLWWWRSFHCDRLGRHLPSLKKNNNDNNKKKIYIYIYTWNLYTFRFLIKKAMDEVCTCHTKGKIPLLLLHEGVTWQVLSNQIPIYIYILSRLGLYVMTSCQLFFRTALPLSHWSILSLTTRRWKSYFNLDCPETRALRD